MHHVVMQLYCICWDGYQLEETINMMQANHVSWCTSRWVTLAFRLLYRISNRHITYIYLTRWGRVMHICAGKPGHHWLRWWLVACYVPSHYLNQWYSIVNWTFRNKVQWDLYWNLYIVIEENAFENVVCEMATILSRPQCVKYHENQIQ